MSSLFSFSSPNSTVSLWMGAIYCLVIQVFVKLEILMSIALKGQKRCILVQGFAIYGTRAARTGVRLAC